jgi:hypothetical protein
MEKALTRILTLAASLNLLCKIPIVGEALISTIAI